MQQILKRLELIKSSIAIAIDDEEIIELQIMKLKKLELDSEVKNILLKLENLDYGSVAIDIENYIKKYTGVVEYIDTEVRGLRLELKALEKKLQDLSELKNEYLNDIDEFNTLYSIKLGDIIQKILKLQEELLQNAIDEKQKEYDETEKVYRNTKDTVDEIKKHIETVEEILSEIDEDDEDYDELYTTYQELKEDLQRLENELDSQEEELRQAKEELEVDPLLEEHEEAKANYEEYSSEYEDIKHTQDDVCTISDKEKQKLKKLFRKASRLCHPDLVTDELKKQAHELMLQLNEAYSKKDLEKVRKILSSLEKGTGFILASDSIDDKKILKAKISEFRENISDLEADIEDIKQDDTFKTIQNIEDLDEYFEEMYIELEAKYDELKQASSTKPCATPEIVNTIIEDILSEPSEDLNYFSTTATAKEHNLKARPHLFDRLIELNLLYKDRDNKYKLTTSGEKIGGKYKENEKGNTWVVWKEHSLDKIIEDLKENLGFVSSDIQKLTPHQLEVYKHIAEDINDIFNDNNVDNRLSLSGSAGVGKTFLTIKIIEELQKKNYELVVTAPTHKALSVITDSLKRYGIKNVKSKTLHSFLKLKLEIDEESGEKVFVADTKKQDEDKVDILIADESSMIGNDLFSFINDTIASSRVGAVLFVGDPYQLPPVNSEKNPIFKLEKSYFLEQVIRQEKDSYIISIATKIRDCIINKDFSHSIKSFFSDKPDGLKVFSDRDKFLTEFYTNDGQNWNNKNQIIADYTNDSVDFYNKISREKYWEDRGNLKPKQIEVGDIVVFQDSYMVDKEVIHQNGSIVQIKKCSKQHDDKLGLKYWLCTDQYGDNFRVMKNSSNPSYMKMLQEKIDAAKSAKSGFEKRNKWIAYYKLKERYASIKFNYASTIHKLQGSTYETVFIDIRKMISLYKYSDKTDTEFLYRLLYVAVTRASKDIVILK